MQEDALESSLGGAEPRTSARVSPLARSPKVKNPSKKLLAQASLNMSVSLGGLVNMSRLEDIINGLLGKIQLQSEQIHRLSTEVKTRASMADIRVFNSRLHHPSNTYIHTYIHIHARFLVLTFHCSSYTP